MKHQMIWYENEGEYQKYIENLAPVVVFSYKRLTEVKKTINALKGNRLAMDSELFVFSDGFKSEEDKTLVVQVREYLKTISGFKSVTIIYRDSNYGLAENIINGVTEIIGRYGKIIVLEDDIVTSPFFLQYMNDALTIYQNDSRVMEISGYSYPVDIHRSPETVFLHFGDCWGWGTWKRSWKLFERNPRKLVEEFTKKDIYRFNLDNSFHQWNQVIDNFQGKLYTWAVFWAATIYKNNGYMLYPYKSLVCNIGFSGNGEHGKTNVQYNDKMVGSPINEFSVEVYENKEVRKKLSKFFKKAERQNFILKIKIKVKTIIAKLLIKEKKGIV